MATTGDVLLTLHVATAFAIRACNDLDTEHKTTPTADFFGQARAFLATRSSSFAAVGIPHFLTETVFE